MIYLNPLRKNITTLLTLAMFVMLSACGSGSGSGGGGGGGGGGVSKSVDNKPVQTNDLAYLNAAQDNELVSVTELDIEVLVNAGRSFLSICDGLAEEFNVNTLDYDRCILRTPLDDSFKTFTLKLPNHVDKLVAIVWFYEAGKPPLVKHWQRTTPEIVMDATWRVSENS